MRLDAWLFPTPGHQSLLDDCHALPDPVSGQTSFTHYSVTLRQACRLGMWSRRAVSRLVVRLLVALVILLLLLVRGGIGLVLRLIPGWAMLLVGMLVTIGGSIVVLGMIRCMIIAPLIVWPRLTAVGSLGVRRIAECTMIIGVVRWPTMIVGAVGGMIERSVGLMVQRMVARPVSRVLAWAAGMIRSVIGTMRGIAFAAVHALDAIAMLLAENGLMRVLARGNIAMPGGARADGQGPRMDVGVVDHPRAGMAAHAAAVTALVHGPTG